MNEGHAAQVREIELFAEDYFAEPEQRRRQLRILDDKKIRDTIAFHGNARDTLDAIWQAAGRPTIPSELFGKAHRTAAFRWRGMDIDGKVQMVREFISSLEVID